MEAIPCRIKPFTRRPTCTLYSADHAAAPNRAKTHGRFPRTTAGGQQCRGTLPVHAQVIAARRPPRTHSRARLQRGRHVAGWLGVGASPAASPGRTTRQWDVGCHQRKDLRVTARSVSPASNYPDRGSMHQRTHPHSCTVSRCGKFKRARFRRCRAQGRCAWWHRVLLHRASCSRRLSTTSEPKARQPPRMLSHACLHIAAGVTQSGTC